MNTQNDNSYTAYIGIDWALFQFASIVHFSRVCNTVRDGWVRRDGGDALVSPYQVCQ